MTNNVYTVIQKKRSIVWDVAVLVIVREKNSHEDVSNSESLLRYNCSTLERTFPPNLYYNSHCFCICRFRHLYLGNHSELDTNSLNVFLTMIDIITSQIIDLYFWINLYTVCSRKD